MRPVVAPSAEPGPVRTAVELLVAEVTGVGVVEDVRLAMAVSLADLFDRAPSPPVARELSAILDRIAAVGQPSEIERLMAEIDEEIRGGGSASPVGNTSDGSA